METEIYPCNKCNADGTVYGEKHYRAWMEKKN